MSFGDDIAAQLPEFRDWAESLMEDTCKIGPLERGDELDETTGEYEKVLVPVYEGVCRLKFSSSVVSAEAVAGQVLAVRDGVLSLPVEGSEAVEEGMTVEYVSAPNDPSLVGRRFRVKGEFSQTHATARRLSVEVPS